ncbi:MAG: protein-glutamate O-methyltransferase CheR [Candidatus Marinimicrobia bacterium]|nr:protein-glutamate O-methyltransferase CheR [Candidatus Neomarinimicrobiota bacterium]
MGNNAGHLTMTAIATVLSPTLDVDQFRELRDIIYEKSGIFYTENKIYLLENRLGRRIKDLGMNSFKEYISHIRSQDGRSEEFHQIYNAVTINETFFFRYQAQLDAFKNKLLVPLIKDRQASGKKRISVWSAASSSGEELYTIAIMVHEVLGTQIKEWDIRLLGTDISHRALKLANEAVYTKNSFRGAMRDQQKQQYFDEDGLIFKLKTEIKDLAQFRYLNLNDDAELRKLRGLDFIFCRNVLIYFDEEMKKRVLRSMYGVLNHGGYFFLGEAESLHGISSSFTVEHFSGAFAYKKE